MISFMHKFIVYRYIFVINKFWNFHLFIILFLSKYSWIWLMCHIYIYIYRVTWKMFVQVTGFHFNYS